MVTTRCTLPKRTNVHKTRFNSCTVSLRTQPFILQRDFIFQNALNSDVDTTIRIYTLDQRIEK